MKKIIAVSALVLGLGTSAVYAQGGDPLAELAALGSAVSEKQPEAGGSIRAKKEGDVARTQRLNDAKNIEAKVDEVTTKTFPLVALKLKVQKPAKDGAGKDMKANDTVVVVPKLKVTGTAVDVTDPATQLNAGAFYLQSGDKVAVRLGANKGTYYEAEYIERK